MKKSAVKKHLSALERFALKDTSGIKGASII